MENIKFDRYKSVYEKQLKKLISETWGYNKVGDEKAAMALAGLFLSGSLAGSDFCAVAVMGEKPVGIIAGRTTDRPNLYFALKHLWYKRFLYLSGNRQMYGVMRRVAQLDDELAGTAVKNGAELSVFAVEEQCRGMGVGSALFEKFLDYAQEKSPDFYLFTDTSCNYPFYLKRGMEMVARKREPISIRGVLLDIEYYLFVGNAVKIKNMCGKTKNAPDKTRSEAGQN